MAGKIVNKLLGSRFREAREAAGLSQLELSAAAGIGQTTIAEIEGGRIRRPKKLRELALVLKSSESWLLGETNENVFAPQQFQYNGTDLVDAPLAEHLQPGMFRPLQKSHDEIFAINTLVPRETRVPGELSAHVVKGNDQIVLGVLDGDLVIASDFVGSRIDLAETMLVVVGRTIDGITSETTLRKVCRKDGRLHLTLGEGSQYADVILMNPPDKAGQSKDQHGYTVKIFGIAVRLSREIAIPKN